MKTARRQVNHREKVTMMPQLSTEQRLTDVHSRRRLTNVKILVINLAGSRQSI